MRRDDDRERSRELCIVKKGEDRRIARCLFGLNNNGVKISSEAALCAWVGNSWSWSCLGLFIRMK